MYLGPNVTKPTAQALYPFIIMAIVRQMPPSLQEVHFHRSCYRRKADVWRWSTKRETFLTDLDWWWDENHESRGYAFTGQLDRRSTQFCLSALGMIDAQQCQWHE